jgi:hypothetical protein
MVGSPDAGTTLLARTLPGILPEMGIEESLDVTRIYSVADQLPAGTPLIRHRPFRSFRSPHHTISHAGLAGCRREGYLDEKLQFRSPRAQVSSGFRWFSCRFWCVLRRDFSPTGSLRQASSRRRKHPKPGEISLAHHGVLFLNEPLNLLAGVMLTFVPGLPPLSLQKLAHIH